MIIDLSHRLEEGMPTFPSDPQLKVSVAATFAEKNYLGHQVTMGTHAGTHIDAPSHMIENAKTLDTFAVDTFVGRGCYILVKDNTFSLDDVQRADIREGDVVVFNTNMSYKYYDPEYFTDFPVMSEDIANYLVSKKVKVVGVDTCSIDKDPSFPIHKILLGNNIPVIEGLTNLEQLANLQATIYALPIRLNLDAAPARVIAEVH